MKNKSIEEVVEELIKEFSTTELVLDTTDEYYIKGTSGDFADALKHALTQAHKSGIDEAVEKIEEISKSGITKGRDWLFKKEAVEAIKALQDNK